MHRFIYDPDHDERYVPDELQCEFCVDEAGDDGLCDSCREILEDKENELR